jgi:hypothetical protein
MLALKDYEECSSVSTSSSVRDISLEQDADIPTGNVYDSYFNVASGDWVIMPKLGALHEKLGMKSRQVEGIWLNSWLYHLQSSETFANTVIIEGMLGSIRREGIIVSNPNEIQDYLLYHSDMIEFLKLIITVSLDKFDYKTQLELKIYNDPEIDDSYLALYLRQEEYDANILEAIEDVCIEFEDELADKSGWFELTTDYQPPI